MGCVSAIIALVVKPSREHAGYDASVLGLPAVGEGTTQEHAVWNLCDALQDYLGARGMADAVGRLRLWMEVWSTDGQD
jgi:hypothetical protein